MRIGGLREGGKLMQHQPSLLFASDHNPDIDTVGHELDSLLVEIIELLGGDAPNQLRTCGAERNSP